jgi:hypothetical protein
MFGSSSSSRVHALALCALVMACTMHSAVAAADAYPSSEVDNVEAVLECRRMDVPYGDNLVCGRGKCSKSNGAFVIWGTNDLSVLPAERQDGFPNSEWTRAGKQSNFVKNNYVDSKGNLFQNLHCHWTPDGGSALWVRLCQHQTQRQYLRGLSYQEVCDGAQLGKDSTLTNGNGPLVTRCDCTQSCPTNNNCGMQQCLDLAELNVKCNNCGQPCNYCHRRGTRLGWSWDQKIACIKSSM